jgi:hypothetical protein
MFLQNTLIAQDKMPQILQHFQADKGSLERFYVIDMSPETIVTTVMSAYSILGVIERLGGYYQIWYRFRGY